MNWRTTDGRARLLLATGIAFWVCGIAAVYLGLAFGAELLDPADGREADATVTEMISEHVDAGWFKPPVVMLRAHYKYRGADDGERTGSDLVATGTTLDFGQTLRVWYTDGGRSGVAGGSGGSAAWGVRGFVAAACVALLSVVVFGWAARCRPAAAVGCKTTDPVAGQCEVF
jgi:hypothetical protein